MNELFDHQVVALRDFFAAPGQAAMRAAYAALAQGDPAAPVVSDWDEVEFAFNRLFVGPAKLIAPPYASVHMDAEARLMSEATLAAREVYRALGLAAPDASTPDDHLAYELDGAIALRFAFERAQEQDAADLAAMRQSFIMDHMGTWVPVFAERVRRAEPPAAIGYVLDRLEGWLAVEKTEVEASAQTIES